MQVAKNARRVRSVIIWNTFFFGSQMRYIKITIIRHRDRSVYTAILRSVLQNTTRAIHTISPLFLPSFLSLDLRIQPWMINTIANRQNFRLLRTPIARPHVLADVSARQSVGQSKSF